MQILLYALHNDNKSSKSKSIHPTEAFTKCQTANQSSTHCTLSTFGAERMPVPPNQPIRNHPRQGSALAAGVTFSHFWNVVLKKMHNNYTKQSKITAWYFFALITAVSDYV